MKWQHGWQRKDCGHLTRSGHRDPYTCPKCGSLEFVVDVSFQEIRYGWVHRFMLWMAGHEQPVNRLIVRKEAENETR